MYERKLWLVVPIHYNLYSLGSILGGKETKIDNNHTFSWEKQAGRQQLQWKVKIPLAEGQRGVGTQEQLTQTEKLTRNC